MAEHCGGSSMLEPVLNFMAVPEISCVKRPRPSDVSATSSEKGKPRFLEHRPGKDVLRNTRPLIAITKDMGAKENLR